MGLIEGLRTSFTHLSHEEATRIVRHGVTEDDLEKYRQDSYLDVISAAGMGSIGEVATEQQKEELAYRVVSNRSKELEIKDLREVAFRRVSPFSLVPWHLQKPTPPEGEHTNIIPKIKLFGYR